MSLVGLITNAVFKGYLWTCLPSYCRKRQAFFKAQDEISFKSPMAHVSAIITRLRRGPAKNYTCPKGWRLPQVFFNSFVFQILKQHSESNPTKKRRQSSRSVRDQSDPTVARVMLVPSDTHSSLETQNLLHLHKLSSFYLTTPVLNHLQGIIRPDYPTLNLHMLLILNESHLYIYTSIQCSSS